jgi:predicted DNA-binding transcriptional regulator AlpA
MSFVEFFNEYCHNQGLGVDEMAKMLGCTRGTIRWHMTNNNIMVTRFTRKHILNKFGVPFDDWFNKWYHDEYLEIEEMSQMSGVSTENLYRQSKKLRNLPYRRCQYCFNEHQRTGDYCNKTCMNGTYIINRPDTTINCRMGDNLSSRATQLKRKLVDYKGGKCKSCGYSKYLSAMCFHHTRDKMFTLDNRNLCKKTWNEVLIEADKCKLMCHNCHNTHHEITDTISKSASPSDLRRYARGDLLKRKLIELAGGACEFCGFTSEHLRCMSFDHIDPSTKSWGITKCRLGSMNIEKIIEEFNKCRLLCMNCHMAMNPHR